MTKLIFYLPHGECQFIFLLPPCGDISFAPHSSNQISLCLMARINFIPPTRQFVPHGGNQCSFCLTVRISFIPPLWFAPDGDINFLLPHGDNQFFFVSRQFFPPLGNIMRLWATIYNDIQPCGCAFGQFSFIIFCSVAARYQFLFGHTAAPLQVTSSSIRFSLAFINSNQVPVQDIILISSVLSRYSRIL